MRAFARALAGGADANRSEVEAQRRRLERWVGGHHRPRGASAQQLADALQVPVGLILSAYREAEIRDRYRRELERLRSGLSEAEARLDGEAPRQPDPEGPE